MIDHGSAGGIIDIHVALKVSNRDALVTVCLEPSEILHKPLRRGVDPRMFCASNPAARPSITHT